MSPNPIWLVFLEEERSTKRGYQVARKAAIYKPSREAFEEKNLPIPRP
jgi:signal recognition particle subunit SEC65